MEASRENVAAQGDREVSGPTQRERIIATVQYLRICGLQIKERDGRYVIADKDLTGLQRLRVEEAGFSREPRIVSRKVGTVWEWFAGVE
jgi:hypothetical protein